MSIREVEWVFQNRGAHAACPRDGKKGAAYVDTLVGEDNVGAATHMLSYSSDQQVRDILDSLAAWRESQGLNPKRTYIWTFCLCQNFHRRRKKSRRCAWDDLAEILSKRIASIGRVVAVMAPVHAPLATARSWCLMELYLAATLLDPGSLELLWHSRPEEFVSEEVWHSQSIKRALNQFGSLRVEDAEATFPEDHQGIVNFSDKTGRAVFEETIASLLQDGLRSFASTFADDPQLVLRERPRKEAPSKVQDADELSPPSSPPPSMVVTTPPCSDQHFGAIVDDADDVDYKDEDDKQSVAEEVTFDDTAPHMQESQESRDFEWDLAFRIVDETDMEVSRLMAEARTAPKAAARSILARKQRLTTSPEYLSALRYLEDPAAERERRQLERAIGGVALEKVFFDVPTEPSAFEPADDGLEVLACCAGERVRRRPPPRQFKDRPTQEPISVYHL